MKPSIGRIVVYRLTAENAQQINRRRTCGKSIAERIAKNSEAASHWPIGAQAHIGQDTHREEEFPMMITRIWANGKVSGQVFLDGNDVFWAEGVGEGAEAGQWHWPERAN